MKKSTKDDDSVYYVGTAKNSHRVGEPAKIIGVVMRAFNGFCSRPCFHLQYKNDEEVYSPIDENNYVLISKSDVDIGKIPHNLH